MEVQGNGIHQLQTVKVVAILLRQQQGAAPGCVNVQPDLMFRSDTGDVAQRVDSACVGGAGGGDDRHDLLAVSLRLRNLRLQIGHVHPREFVGFHQRDRAVAEPHQRHVLLHREVGVFGAQYFVLADIPRQPILLDGVSLTGEEGVARQHQPHQVALGAAAGEDAGVACRIADPGAQPLDQLHLNDGRRRALVPGVHALVGGVDQHFRRLANHQARAVQVRHALRVMHRQAVFQEVLDRTINRRLVTQTLFVKFKGDTLTQLVNAFPLIHLRLLQPLHNGLAGLLDNLLIGFNALR